MKKFLSILLAVLMLLCGFAIAEETEVAEEAEAAEVSTEAATSDGALKIEEGTVIVDYEGYTVTLTGEGTDSGTYLYLNVVVVNNADVEISMSLDDVSINGWEVYGGGVSSVNPGKKAKDDISFNLKDADCESFDDIEDIEFTVKLYDSNTYETIYTSDVMHMVP